MHHRAIRKWNDESHAHDHYEYFRSLLAGEYESGLDELLERTITFLDEVRGTPVLLSMLVLIFRFRQKQSDEALPADRFELYMTAMRLAIKNASAMDGLMEAEASRPQEAVGVSRRAMQIEGAVQRIAVDNHMQKRRIFKLNEVFSALPLV